MSCLDKCSNLCVIFLINLFICKWLGLAPRCKHWGPECWIKVCYLLCGLLISFVSVVPDCVTAECCDCLSLSAASALTPRHFFFFIHSFSFDCEKRAAFRGPGLWAQTKAWLPLWYLIVLMWAVCPKFPNFYHFFHRMKHANWARCRQVAYCTGLW